MASRPRLAGLALAQLLLVAQPAAAQQGTPAASVDAAIGRRSLPDAPGCAVAVSRGGRPVLERAFGLAHLEHGIPNRPDTVFEAGSASKQFTAAAILLLAREGRIALDADIRRYLPELADLGEPITVDQLLNHSSGMRDWRFLFGMAGWMPGTRVHDNADALAIVARQRGLNHAPGASYAYTNSGYTLATFIVARVTGQSFAQFTRERIFEPLGMARTQWRDDFRRVVPGRATAYSPASRGWTQDMPFENAHGPGGLLTTVGDLLRWNAALDQDRLGITAQLQERAALDDGTRLAYARGLFVERHRGLDEFGHGGVTSGYRAWTGRYPAQRLAVAVLCNSGGINPAELARELADAHLPPQLLALPAHEGGPTAEQPPVPPPVSGAAPERWRPNEAELASLAGRYASDEIGAVYVAAVENGRLVVRIDGRPGQRWILGPTVRNSFVFPGGVMRFERSPSGAGTELRVTTDRVSGLRFLREGE
jgi:CubicO group peptidase (beta-lactamase class C family)